MNSFIPNASTSMLNHSCCLKYLTSISFFCMFFCYLTHILHCIYLSNKVQGGKKKKKKEHERKIWVLYSSPSPLLTKLSPLADPQAAISGESQRTQALKFFPFPGFKICPSLNSTIKMLDVFLALICWYKLPGCHLLL